MAPFHISTFIACLSHQHMNNNMPALSVKLGRNHVKKTLLKARTTHPAADHSGSISFVMS